MPIRKFSCSSFSQCNTCVLINTLLLFVNRMLGTATWTTQNRPSATFRMVYPRNEKFLWICHFVVPPSPKTPQVAIIAATQFLLVNKRKDLTTNEVWTSKDVLVGTLQHTAQRHLVRLGYWNPYCFGYTIRALWSGWLKIGNSLIYYLPSCPTST